MSKDPNTLPNVIITAKTSQDDLKAQMAALLEAALPVFKAQHKKEWDKLKKAFSREGSPKGEGKGQDKQAYVALRDRARLSLEELVTPHLIFDDAEAKGTQLVLRKFLQETFSNKYILRFIFETSKDSFSQSTENALNLVSTSSPVELIPVMIAAKDASGAPTPRADIKEQNLKDALEEKKFPSDFAQAVSAQMRKLYPYAYCLDKQIESLAATLDKAFPDKTNLPSATEALEAESVKRLILNLEQRTLTSFISYARMHISVWNRDPQHTSQQSREEANAIQHAEARAKELGIDIHAQESSKASPKPRLAHTLSQRNVKLSSLQERSSDAATATSSSPTLGTSSSKKAPLQRMSSTQSLQKSKIIPLSTTDKLVIDEAMTALGFESLLQKLIEKTFKEYLSSHPHESKTLLAGTDPTLTQAATKTIIKTIKDNVAIVQGAFSPFMPVLSDNLSRILQANIPYFFTGYDAHTQTFRNTNNNPTPHSASLLIAQRTPHVIDITNQVKHIVSKYDGEDLKRFHKAFTDAINDKLDDLKYPTEQQALLSEGLKEAVHRKHPYAYSLGHLDDAVDALTANIPAYQEKQSIDKLVENAMEKAGAQLAAYNQENINLLSAYLSSRIGQDRSGLSQDQRDAIISQAKSTEEQHHSREAESPTLSSRTQKRGIKPDDITAQRKENGQTTGITPNDIRAQQKKSSDGPGIGTK